MSSSLCLSLSLSSLAMTCPQTDPVISRLRGKIFLYIDPNLFCARFKFCLVNTENVYRVDRMAIYSAHGNINTRIAAVILSAGMVFSKIVVRTVNLFTCSSTGGMHEPSSTRRVFDASNGQGMSDKRGGRRLTKSQCYGVPFLLSLLFRTVMQGDLNTSGDIPLAITEQSKQPLVFFFLSRVPKSDKLKINGCVFHRDSLQPDAV